MQQEQYIQVDGDHKTNYETRKKWCSTGIHFSISLFSSLYQQSLIRLTFLTLFCLLATQIHSTQTRM